MARTAKKHSKQSKILNIKKNKDSITTSAWDTWPPQLRLTTPLQRHVFGEFPSLGKD
jgi:hypothetical protein